MDANDVEAAEPMTFRQQSLARRLLSGEGAATVDAYCSRLTLDPVIHGLTPFGSLVIVTAEPVRDSSLHPAQTRGWHGVRVDLSKDAADPRLMARVATVHALGTMRWLGPEETVLLPPHCAAALEELGPRGCVGIVECPRLLIHDWTGVATATLHELLADGIPELDRDWGLNWGIGCGEGALSQLAEGVRRGEIRGEICPCDVMPMAAGLPYDSFCLDADAFGLTLLRCEADGASIVFLPFGHSNASGPRMSSAGRSE